MIELQLEVVDRNSSIRVDGSVHPKAEDIFDGFIRGFNLEGSEQRAFFSEGLLEPEIGDFLGGGVDLLVIIAVEFEVKNPLSMFDLGDILPDTGSDESILGPAIGSFNLTSGLGRKGVNHLHVAILQDLLPLRGGLVGQEVVLIPEGVSSADKSEDGVRIDIAGVRESILKDDGLEGQDMGPAGLFVDQNGIEHEPTIIIQRGDEVPFFLGSGSPEMIGGVMLNQFPNITG